MGAVPDLLAWASWIRNCVPSACGIDATWMPLLFSKAG